MSETLNCIRAARRGDGGGGGQGSGDAVKERRSGIEGTAQKALITNNRLKVTRM